jgi:hypothetical protein
MCCQIADPISNTASSVQMMNRPSSQFATEVAVRRKPKAVETPEPIVGYILKKWVTTSPNTAMITVAITLLHTGSAHMAFNFAMVPLAAP